MSQRVGLAKTENLGFRSDDEFIRKNVTLPHNRSVNQIEIQKQTIQFMSGIQRQSVIRVILCFIMLSSRGWWLHFVHFFKAVLFFCVALV